MKLSILRIVGRQLVCFCFFILFTWNYLLLFSFSFVEVTSRKICGCYLIKVGSIYEWLRKSISIIYWFMCGAHMHRRRYIYARPPCAAARVGRGDARGWDAREVGPTGQRVNSVDVCGRRGSRCTNGLMWLVYAPDWCSKSSLISHMNKILMPTNFFYLRWQRQKSHT